MPDDYELNRTRDIHAETYVKGLFDEMAQTYGIVNILSSLGFAYIWRKQALASIPRDCIRIADLMCGGGESLPHILRRCGPSAEVCLVDWSESMCERAERTLSRKRANLCRIVHCNTLNLPDEANSYDAVVSTFGLKTLSPSEHRLFANELKRILKPGGVFSLLEFSLPENPLIQFFFRLYVKYYVPFLGWIFLGNPDNYRMLWKYTKEFSNCRKLIPAFEAADFKVEYKSHFFGSATQLVGRLPK